MPSSHQRQSGASIAASQRAQLPAYQPLSHPLTPSAQRTLNQLLTKHASKELDKHLQNAIEALRESAGQLNENFVDDEVNLKRQRDRLQKQKDGDNLDAETNRLEVVARELEATRADVAKMTKQMDDSVRKMIDGRKHVDFVSDALTEISHDIVNAAVSQPTQGRSQARSQRRRRGNPDEDEDEGDEQYQDFTPTDPAGGPTQATQTAQPASKAFTEKLDRKKDRWQSNSLYQRYATDNDYRTFRRFVHDAKHSHMEDAPALAHERTWFEEGTAPQPGMTTRGAAADNDDDDDLAIAKETISTKCPLTLREFQDPLTSTKCPHSFEREAIMELIDSPMNTVRLGPGRTGLKAVQCPVPGCTSMLSKNELQEDPVLKRKIARLQRAARMAEEDDEDEDPGSGKRRRQVQEIESDDNEEGGMDIDDIEGPTSSNVRLKVERSSTRRRVVDDIEDDD